MNILLVYLTFLTVKVSSIRFVKHPDLDLPMPQVIQKHGFPVETHKMITQDGYITEGFRIPGGRYSKVRLGEPVLLLHGLCGCSENFINAGPNSSIAYFLADHGYDVWIVNNRGNRHGRAHQIMDPDKNASFWNFGLHEIGIYDIPGFIDYILEVTNRTQLFYIGHSGGSTSYLMLAADRPEYSDKIKLAVLMGPPAIFTKPTAMTAVLNYISPLLQKFGIIEILPPDLNKLLNNLLKLLCAEVTIMAKACVAFFHLGNFPKHMDLLTAQIAFQTSPAGCSIQALVHYYQMQQKGNFYKYDYGIEGNLKSYKSRRAPLYNLTNAKAPIALFQAPADKLVDTNGVFMLSKKLPNLATLYVVPPSDFAHIDFIFGKNNNEIVNEPILKLFNKYS